MIGYYFSWFFHRCFFIYSSKNFCHLQEMFQVDLFYRLAPRTTNVNCVFQKSLSALKVLQLSDVHLDPDYEEKTVANCEEPLCCRSYSTPKLTEPKVLSGRFVNFAYNFYSLSYDSFNRVLF